MQLTRRKKLNDLELHVRQGQIKQSEKEKYVGVTINEKGNNADRLMNSADKATLLSKLTNDWGSPFKVGHLAIKTRIFLINNLALHSIFHTAETWTNITNQERESIERIHKHLLTNAMEIEQSAPYFGILIELGEWPIIQTIHYKMMMLLQHFIASDDQRLAKQVLLGQARSQLPGNWYSNLNEIGELYGINVSVEEVSLYKKSLWKQMIKERINEWVLDFYCKKIDTMKKLKFLKKPKKLQMNPYLQNLPLDLARMVLRTRLNMLKVKSNYKGTNKDLICHGCHLKEDTTEHLFQCWKNEWMTGVKMKSDMMHSSSMDELKKMAILVSNVEKAKEMLK